MTSTQFILAFAAFCTAFIGTMLLLVNGGHRSKRRWLLIGSVWLVPAAFISLAADDLRPFWFGGSAFLLFLVTALVLSLYDNSVSPDVRKKIESDVVFIHRVASIFSGRIGSDD